MQGRFQRAGAGNVTIKAEVGGMQPHVKEVLEPPETQETRAGCFCRVPRGSRVPPGLGLLASRPVGKEIPIIFSFSPVGGNLSRRLQKPVHELLARFLPCYVVVVGVIHILCIH